MARAAQLDANETADAMRSVRRWQQQRPAAEVTCPRCSTGGLVIVDQSARPFAEWYKLTCTACGLDATLHAPLAPPASD